MSEILLCAFALALPAAVFWAYRRGLRAGADPARPGKILPETPAAARRRQAREQQALLKRIDAYDGGVRR